MLGRDALCMRMPAVLDVAFRRDHHVLAHRVEQAAAEWAAVRRRPVAVRAAHRPPAWSLHTGSLACARAGEDRSMSTYPEQRRRTGWSRTRWLVLGAVLVAIAVAIVLVVVYSGGGGSGGGGGY